MSGLIYNIEAEQSVLGSILQQNELLDVVKEFLRAVDFYDNKHKLIYKKMLELSDKQKPIDYITLSEILDNDVVPLSYLIALTENIVPVNIIYHSQIIIEKAIIREIRKESINAKGDLEEEDIKKYLNKVQGLYEKLATLRLVKKEPKSFSVDYGVELLKKAPKGKKTGYTKLDEIIDFNPSELIIIASRPRHGKTTFAMNLLLNMAKLYPDEVFIYFTYEVDFSQFFRKMLSWASGFSYQKIKNFYLEDRLPEEVYKGQEKLREYEGNIYIVDEPNFTVDQIITYCKQVKKNKPLGAVFVDYIELVKEQKDRDGNTEELRIASIVHKLRIASQELGTPIIALAQMNRATVGKKQPKNRRPTLEGLRYSGRQEAEATTVLGLFNVEREKITIKEEEGELEPDADKVKMTDLEVIPLKCRYASSNQIITLNYNMEGNKIE